MKKTLPWQMLAWLLAAIVGFPILMILLQWGNLGQGEQDIWQHLFQTRFDQLALNTLVLMTGVALLVCLLGISLAWLVTMCRFPGQRIFEWALMLPLAIPGYVMAFVYLGLFSYAGPVQGMLRGVFGSSDWFPDIRSAPGVILVLSLVLYPYVYMLARAAFLFQGRSMFEAARILGLSPTKAFWRVALPVARPAIAGGLALALMETLADFGAVSVLNFDTFTTAIYTAWYGLFNLSVAAQLASLLLLFVAVTLALEHYSRRQARYDSGNRSSAPAPFRLQGIKGLSASVYCVVVLSLAFGLPLGRLLFWVFATGFEELDTRYLDFLGHTLMLAASAALLTAVLALLLVVINRLSSAGTSSPWRNAATRVATLGYALPGSVLAVGIMLATTWLDLDLLPLLNLPPLFTNTVLALLLAYLTRFLAVAHTPVVAGFATIGPSITDAARSLGAGPLRVVLKIYLPMLKPGLLTALILVFVDVMKEMPATLIMRPFGWETLAVRIYQMTAEGQWERAALPALTLLLVGLVPVALLVRSSSRTAP